MAGFMEASSPGASAPRRSARARREQRARAAARMVGSIIKASSLLASHRGCQPGLHLAELADLLVGRPPAPTSPPSIPARSRARPQAISLSRKPTALINLFVDSGPSAAEVMVGDGEFDPGIRFVVTSGGVEMDLVIPLAVDDIPRQSVPQLVQLFELQASRQGRAAQPLRLPIIQEEDTDDEDEDDLSAGSRLAFDERMRAFDERIGGYYAALNASYCEDPG